MHAELTKLDAVVLGVSTDSLASHEKFAAKHGLSFPLLADVNAEISQKYGVYKEKNLYGRKYMGIERTTFLIDVSGNIAIVYPKVKVDAHAVRVLNDTARLMGK